MRTKTVLLTAALGAISIATSVAQTVYSVNAVGYVNITVKAGQFALLANPLNQGDNKIATIMPDVPVNTAIYTWNGTAFDSATKRTSGWSGGAKDAVLAPGQGFFIKNVGTTDFTITFVGEVPQGDLKVAFGAGLSLLGSPVPQTGKVETELKMPAQVNDKLYQFVAGNYSQYTKRATGWSGGGEPSISVAEGFWYQAGAAGNWTRSFNVNN
jgi:hypothetical protein